MRVGLLSFGDYRDRRLWSGTITTMAEAISSDFELVPLRVPNKGLGLARRVASFASGGMSKRVVAPYPLLGAIADRLISSSRCDIVFAPAASEILASMGRRRRDVPIIYLSDATYHCMDGYYFLHESEQDRKNGNRAEELAIAVSSHSIFSSEWAASDAIEWYGADSSEVSVVCFGSNLPDLFLREGKKVIGDVMSLLLVGVDWERKGITTACETVQLLNELDCGRRYELTVVGATPPKGESYPNVKFTGFLNKNKPSDVDKMTKLYLEADAFILPTKAECAGIVFCEAAMYGLPTFTYRTGGTASYVEDGVTGRTLEMGSGAQAFAGAMLEMLDGEVYPAWSKAARTKYETQLNWGAWEHSFREIAESVVTSVRG